MVPHDVAPLGLWLVEKKNWFLSGSQVEQSMNRTQALNKTELSFEGNG